MYSFWHWLIEVLSIPVEGNGGLSEANVNPRNVLLTPSGPTKSGFWRTRGVASRVPDVSNRMGAPPCDENGSNAAGVVPQAGVWK